MAHEDYRKNWIESNRRIPRRFVRPALRFTKIEAASGIVLIVAAILAMLWANLSVFGNSYSDFWGTSVEFQVAGLHLEETFKDLVNDGLMAIFFFVVGMEIKRELSIGELRDPKKAALPAMAAVGGMVVPALIYVFFVLGDGGQALQGWGIPMATDIAFSLGVLALLGSRAPIGAKLFLLTLAIVDDIGAIAVIAIFYTDDLSLGWLSIGLGGIALISVGSQVNIRALSFYLTIGVVTWFAFLESGVHATIAGVVIGLLTPALPLYTNREYDDTARRILDYYPATSDEPNFQDLVDHEALLLADVARESVAPLNRIEHALHNWSSFAIVPIFALANAGVRMVGTDVGSSLTSSLALGVAFGLVVGKTVGVTLFAWIALKTGLGRMPAGVQWRHLVGVAMLAGIGFTVSLFIAELAFDDPVLIDLAKIGIFAGSIIAGFAGYFFLRSATSSQSDPTEPQPADSTSAG